jgi:aspartyl-tRNA(Asn)/glutamyl-tRNA(Gln) amidotransferase subunit B
MPSYELVVGLELHAQLSTESKIFAPDPARFGASPNRHVSAITLGHPGTLPRLNRRAVEFAVKMGLACGCQITRRTIFDRKNYFYPDLPKGYQISQDKAPICVGGAVYVTLKSGEERALQLHHIHLEEDAGKSIHAEGEPDTLLDYNRAGTPLIEIVTEPVMRSAEEAGACLAEIRKLVRYLGICDGNMEEGSLRCDVNVSVRPVGQEKLGTKVEVKNMNSVRFVQRAVEYEFERQVGVLESGGRIIQETRTFDAATGRTAGMREKETMNDYRYFPEPDLPPVVISEQWLGQIQAGMPALPRELFQKFISHYGLPAADATLLTENREDAAWFEELCRHTANFKSAANWLMGPVRAWLNESGREIGEFPIAPAQLARLMALVDESRVSHTTASQRLFPELLAQPAADPLRLAEALNVLQQSNSDSIQALIDEVLAAWPAKVKEYRQGKKGLLGLFVGEVMKKSGGKADPKLTNQLLVKTLGTISV